MESKGNVSIRMASARRRRGAKEAGGGGRPADKELAKARRNVFESRAVERQGPNPTLERLPPARVAKRLRAVGNPRIPKWDRAIADQPGRASAFGPTPKFGRHRE